MLNKLIGSDSRYSKILVIATIAWRTDDREVAGSTLARCTAR